MSEELLEVRVLGSAKEIRALDGPQLLYLLVGIRTPPNAAKQHQPLNLCLVIDRSTSMKDKLEPIRSAVIMILNKLGPSDLFSAVTFNDRAEVAVPRTRGGAPNTSLTKIQRMRASGGTEMFHGLEAGMALITQSNISQYANHLILLTDGHTYGDERECLKLARDAALKGIEFSAFGIGTEWNDAFLDRLVALSGGESAYIETPRQVMGHLRKRIKGLDQIYAKNLRLYTDFSLDIEIKAAFKVTPFAQPMNLNGNEIHLGTVEAQSPLAVLLELEIEKAQPGQAFDLPLTLVADVPSASVQDYALERTYRVDAVAGQPEHDPPKILVEAVQAFNFHQMNEKSRQDIEEGRLKSATTRLGHLEKRLLEAGHDELAQQVRDETKKLETQGALSAEGAKRLKYGTRSLAPRSLKFNLNRDESL